MKKILTLLFLTSLTTGCASHPHGVRSGVVVRIAPPALKVVVRPAKPHPHSVWIAGYWDYRGGRYVWTHGRWVNPKKGHVWVDSHWKKTRNGWVRVPGHWKRR
jgi:hypothetical protein